MLLLGNILIGLGTVLSSVLWLIMVLVGIRVILSWVNPDPSNPIVRTVYLSTEPLLAPLRRRLPVVGGVIDLSPIVLFLILAFLDRALVDSILQYGHALRHGGRP